MCHRGLPISESLSEPQRASGSPREPQRAPESLNDDHEDHDDHDDHDDDDDDARTIINMFEACQMFLSPRSEPEASPLRRAKRALLICVHSLFKTAAGNVARACVPMRVQMVPANAEHT